MPVSTFSFTSSAMRFTSSARFTLYGISVMTICSRPPFISSTPTLPAHAHAAAAGLEILPDARRALDDAARREIRAL